MIKAFLVLLAVACTQAGLLRPRTRLPNCKGVSPWQDVLYQNPENCTTYYQCVHEIPVLRSCPKGLDFSQISRRCEYPSIAGCRNVTKENKEDNPCEDVPDWRDVLLKNPENCGSYIQCVHQKPMVRDCPEGLHWNVELTRCDTPELAKCNEDIPPK